MSAPPLPTSQPPADTAIATVQASPTLAEPASQITLSPPFREQLVFKLKSEYRLGEPVGYTIRNIGKPREWSGPVFLHGPGCGLPTVERLDGSTVFDQAPQGEQPAQNRLPVGPSRLCT